MKRKDTPWGLELWWADGPGYLGKILHIRRGHRTSKQYHERKDETLLVQQGILTVVWDEGRSEKYPPNHVVHIPAGKVHRLCAYDGAVTLVEVSTNDPEDVVRLEDDFGRV